MASGGAPSTRLASELIPISTGRLLMPSTPNLRRYRIAEATAQYYPSLPCKEHAAYGLWTPILKSDPGCSSLCDVITYGITFLRVFTGNSTDFKVNQPCASADGELIFDNSSADYLIPVSIESS